MAFQKSFIDEVKYKNSISDVIGRYVVLKRAGSNMQGLCPFHSEKSPSFTVFQDSYYCFGCGAGGDVITFVMQSEGMTYPDAVKSLAERAGIPIPQDSSGYAVKEKKPVLSRERAFEINTAAARIFHANLSLPEASGAREYFSNRELDNATIRRFGLGYALNSFDDLLKKLRAMGFKDEEIKECSLAGISQNGRYYDYFRNRVIFPIIDTDGRVVAFGGRVMDDSKPKYLNSSDTPVFKKSRTLFALNYAKNAALGDASGADTTGKLIMCEGYMDVISLHKAGFGNAVATLGTAVTPEHARRISRYAKTVYLAYDSDSAGQNATKKAIKLLEEAGVEAKALEIKGAKDPDEYIKKYGPAAFRKVLTGAVGETDYRLGEILGRHNMDDPDDKTKAIDECASMLSGVYPLYKREIYVTRLSQLSGVSEASINLEIKRKEARNTRQTSKAMMEDASKKMRHYDDKVNPQAVMHPKAVGIEENILGIILMYPELFPKPEVLCAEDFVTDFNRGVFEKLGELIGADNFDISLLNEVYDPGQVSRIFGMAQKRRALTVNGRQALDEQIAHLKAEKMKIRKKDLDFADRFADVKKRKVPGKGNT